MTYRFVTPLALGSSQTGLTLRATIVDEAGAIQAAQKDLSTGFVEIGAGNYSWDYSGYTAGFRGLVVFHVGDVGGGSDFSGVTVKAISEINPESLEPGRLIWTYSDRTLTVASAIAASQLTESTLSILRGDTLAQDITVVADPNAYDTLWATLKRDDRDTDACADLQVMQVVGGSATLLVVNGVEPTDAEQTASIDIVDTETVTLNISAAATAALKAMSSGRWDISGRIDASDTIKTLNIGALKVLTDVTRRTE